MRIRRGGTLIELLVGLVLLDLALLSLAAVGATTARRIGDANRRARAAIAAANRVERLAGMPCAAMQSGSAPLERGVTETWTARPTGGVAEITDSVEIAARASERVVIRSRASCR